MDWRLLPVLLLALRVPATSAYRQSVFPTHASLQALLAANHGRQTRDSLLDGVVLDSTTGLPQLSSLPASPSKLLLDFDGLVGTGAAGTLGAAWGAFSALPFDLDGNPATFNVDEQLFILDVWLRVREDFAPFNVDVTTVDIGVPGLASKRILHNLITYSRDAAGGFLPATGGPDDTETTGVAQGFAYDVDDNVAVRVSFTYVDRLNELVAAIADTASHEFGHNFGMGHSGNKISDTEDNEYFGGEMDATNPISWGPLMGGSQGSSLSTWSDGDYPGAVYFPLGGDNCNVACDDATDIARLVAALGSVSTGFNTGVADFIQPSGHDTSGDYTNIITPAHPSHSLFIDMPDSLDGLHALKVRVDPAVGTPSQHGQPTQANLNVGVHVTTCVGSDADGYHCIDDDPRFLDLSGPYASHASTVIFPMAAAVADGIQEVYVHVSGIGSAQVGSAGSLGRYTITYELVPLTSLPVAPVFPACVGDAADSACNLANTDCDGTTLTPFAAAFAGGQPIELNDRSLCRHDRDVTNVAGGLPANSCMRATLTTVTPQYLPDVTLSALIYGGSYGRVDPDPPANQIVVLVVNPLPVELSLRWVVQSPEGRAVLPGYSLRIDSPFPCSPDGSALAAPSPPPRNGAADSTGSLVTIVLLLVVARAMA